MALAQLRIIYRSNLHARLWVVAEKSGDLAEKRVQGRDVASIATGEGAIAQVWLRSVLDLNR